MDIHSSFNLITILSDQKKRNLRNDLISEEEIEKKTIPLYHDMIIMGNDNK